MADSAVMNINEAAIFSRVFNFVELWDRFGVLTCVPWFSVLVWQVSGLYIEYNMMSVGMTEMLLLVVVKSVNALYCCLTCCCC